MKTIDQMKAILGIATSAVLLAGCATIADGGEMPVREPGGECEASGVQSMVGQRATAELGARLLRETGATTLRWVPPNTAVTMDFRADRLTVSYDAQMMIERISCG